MAKIVLCPHCGNDDRKLLEYQQKTTWLCISCSKTFQEKSLDRK